MAGRGADTVLLGRGNDAIGLRDHGVRDLIRCGAGRDIVYYRGARDDRVKLVDCEVVHEHVGKGDG